LYSEESSRISWRVEPGGLAGQLAADGAACAGDQDAPALDQRARPVEVELSRGAGEQVGGLDRAQHGRAAGGAGADHRGAGLSGGLDDGLEEGAAGPRVGDDHLRRAAVAGGERLEDGGEVAERAQHLDARARCGRGGPLNGDDAGDLGRALGAAPKLADEVARLAGVAHHHRGGRRRSSSRKTSGDCRLAMTWASTRPKESSTVSRAVARKAWSGGSPPAVPGEQEGQQGQVDERRGQEHAPEVVQRGVAPEAAVEAEQREHDRADDQEEAQRDGEQSLRDRLAFEAVADDQRHGHRRGRHRQVVGEDQAGRGVEGERAPGHGVGGPSAGLIFQRTRAPVSPRTVP
jgi:hypothetical protein